MNLEDKKIQELFSKKLGNMELPVDPQLWVGVQSGIGVGTAGSAATGLGFFAKLALAVASIAVVGTIGFFVLNQEEKALVSETPLSQSEIITNEIEEKDAGLDEKASSPIIGEEADTKASTEMLQESSNQKQAYSTQETTARQLTTSAQKEQVVTDQSSSKDIQNDPGQNNSHTSDELLEHSSPISFEEPASQERVNETPLSAEFSAHKDDYNPYEFTFSTKVRGELNYFWEMGDGTNYSTETVNHEYLEEGDYVVRLTTSNENGETSTQEMFLEVLEPSELIIPNVFTPNNDEKNALFDISRASKNIEIITLIIFNDKQDMVFQSDERADSWDGNDQFGNVCPAGTYRYWIKAIGSDGVSYKRGGNVTLLR